MYDKEYDDTKFLILLSLEGPFLNAKKQLNESTTT